MLKHLLLVAILLFIPGHTPDWRGPLPYPVVADPSARVLFEEAIRWSRSYQLETGGCLGIKFERDTIFLYSVTESVRYRLPHQVGLRCHGGSDRGHWHTHWSAESDSTVQCNLEQAADLYLISAAFKAGVVVCGQGADSLKPYAYDASREPETPDPRILTLPTCSEEPPASIARGYIVRCFQDRKSRRK